MGIVYGLLGILFALVLALFILICKYRSDVDFLKSMFKINNDYVKECSEYWAECFKLCQDICQNNVDLATMYREREDKE